MNHNVNIVGIGLNQYRVSGFVTSLEHDIKTIEHKGEIYSKTFYKEVKIDLDESFDAKRKEWQCYETDFFHKIKKPEIKMWAYSNSHTFVSNYTYSSNEYINYLQTLNELKLLPVNIHCGKSNDFGYNFCHMEQNWKFEVYLDGYGFNNSIITEMSYADIIKTGIKRCYVQQCNYRLNDEIFPNGYEDFDDIKKSELLINWVNKQK